MEEYMSKCWDLGNLTWEDCPIWNIPPGPWKAHHIFCDSSHQFSQTYHFLIGIICKEGKAWNTKQGGKQWAIRWETQTHEVLSPFIVQWNTGFPRAAFLKAGFENGFKLCRKGILHRQKELRSLALKGGFNRVNHKILSQRNFWGDLFLRGETEYTYHKIYHLNHSKCTVPWH